MKFAKLESKDMKTLNLHEPSLKALIFGLQIHSHTHRHTRRQTHPNALRGVTMVKKIVNDILKGQNVPLRLFMVSNLSFFPAACSFKFH